MFLLRSELLVSCLGKVWLASPDEVDPMDVSVAFTDTWLSKVVLMAT